MPLNRFRQRSGFCTRLVAACVLVFLLAPATACNYGFRGGGFPSHVRTVFIEPFDNRSPQYDLEHQLATKLYDRIPSSLGLQPAGREAADAIISGEVVGYDDAAQAYRSGDPTGGLTHQVRVSIRAQIVDVKRNVIIWRSDRITGRGQYDPTSQSDEDGRSAALDDVIRQILDQAQSRW